MCTKKRRKQEDALQASMQCLPPLLHLAVLSAEHPAWPEDLSLLYLCLYPTLQSGLLFAVVVCQYTADGPAAVSAWRSECVFVKATVHSAYEGACSAVAVTVVIVVVLVGYLKAVAASAPHVHYFETLFGSSMTCCRVVVVGVDVCVRRFGVCAWVGRGLQAC
jgi:hypothetical protein